MMKRALIPLMFCVAGVATSQPKPAAPNRPPMTVTTLPGVKIAEAVPAVGTKRIYYTTNKDELFVYDRASKSSTLVGRGVMSEIALSPKNDRIAFGRGSEANARDLHIWTMPLDPATGAASGPARRVSVSAGHAPSVSPDGQQIAFAAKDSAGKEFVAVMPAAGGTELIVDKKPRGLELIRWSPDAQTLYMGDWGRTGDKTAAYHVPAAGGTAALIAKTGSNHPGLSPDGRLIVTINEEWDSLLVATPEGKRLGAFPWINGADGSSWNGNSHLFLPTGTTHRLRGYSMADGSTKALVDSTTDVREAHWSPDGRRIVLGETSGRLAVLNSDGSGLRKIPSGMLIPNCQWSPDGSRILVAKWVTENRWDLKAYEVATGREVTLARSVPHKGIVWFSSGARWAADSKSLFYAQFIDTVAGPAIGARFALHEATLAGTDRVLREVTVYRGRGLGINPPVFGDSIVEIGTRDGAHVFVPLRAGAPETTVMPADMQHGASVPSFSPDGRRVAYRINPNGLDNSVFTRIDVMQRDGTQRSQIELPFNALPGLHNPIFLSDPSQLLVAGQEKRGAEVSFYRMTLDGKTITKLLTIPPLPSYGRPDFVYELSPDGKTLLYLTDEPPFSTFTDIDVSAFLKLSPARKNP